MNGTNLVNGTVDLRLRLFRNATSPTVLYEDQGIVSVVDGLYTTALGDGTTTGSLASAITNSELWLEVVVDGTTLTPRERVGSVAYALMAGSVSTGAITAAMLADGSVASNKLAPGAVQPVNLAKTYQSGRIPSPATSSPQRSC